MGPNLVKHLHTCLISKTSEAYIYWIAVFWMSGIFKLDIYLKFRWIMPLSILLLAIRHSNVFDYVSLMVTEISLNNVILLRYYQIPSQRAHWDKNTVRKRVVGTWGHPCSSTGCSIYRSRTARLKTSQQQGALWNGKINAFLQVFMDTFKKNQSGSREWIKPSLIIVFYVNNIEDFSLDLEIQAWFYLCKYYWFIRYP